MSKALTNTGHGFVQTAQAEQALEMCKTVLGSRQYSRIGQITGDPGTGKSELSYWLADQLDAVRVECWIDMGDKALMEEIATGMNERGHSIDVTGTAPTLFRKIKASCAGQLLLIDEANHLKWGTLEKLRGLSDIGGAGLILIGTDIMAKRLIEARVRIYLTQLRQRIGAKKVTMQVIKDEAELAAYIIAPRFGEVTRKTAKRFRIISGGHWRSALELADACERLMAAEEITVLNDQVVETAAAWMAGQS